MLCLGAQPICTSMTKAFVLHWFTILGPVERDMEARSSPKYFSSQQAVTKYTYVRGLNDYIEYVEAVLQYLVECRPRLFFRSYLAVCDRDEEGISSQACSLPAASAPPFV